MSRAEPRAGRRPIVAAAAVVWGLLLLAWIARLAAEAWTGSLGCELTPGGSVFGTASWGWFPPGVTCTYPLADGATAVEGPPGLRWAIVTVLVLGGLGLLATRSASHRPRH